MEYFDLHTTEPAPGTLCTAWDSADDTKILMWVMHRWWEYAYDEQTNTSSFVMIKNQDQYMRWAASSENAIEVHEPAPTDGYAALVGRVERLENTVSLISEQVFQ